VRGLRQRCPATACPPGHLLDSASLACVAMAPLAEAVPAPNSAASGVAAGVDVGTAPVASLPINSGGDAAVLPPPPPVQLPPPGLSVAPPSPPPEAASFCSSLLRHPLSLLLLVCCCAGIGFALGSWWTRRFGSRSPHGSRGKHAYAYEAGRGSGEDNDDEEEDDGIRPLVEPATPSLGQDTPGSLLPRNASKRKMAPSLPNGGSSVGLSSMA